MAAKIQRCGGSQPSPKAHHSSQQRTAPVSTSFPHTRQRGKARTPTPWAPSKPPRLASTAQAHARLSPPRDSQQPVTAQENPVPLCPARDVTASKVGGGKAAWVHTSHTGGRRERTRGEQIHTAWHHPTPHGTWVAYREVWPADSRPRMPHIRVGIQVRLPAPCPLTPLTLNRVWLQPPHNSPPPPATTPTPQLKHTGGGCHSNQTHGRPRTTTPPPTKKVGRHFSHKQVERPGHTLPTGTNTAGPVAPGASSARSFAEKDPRRPDPRAAQEAHHGYTSWITVHQGQTAKGHTHTGGATTPLLPGVSWTAPLPPAFDSSKPHSKGYGRGRPPRCPSGRWGSSGRGKKGGRAGWRANVGGKWVRACTDKGGGRRTWGRTRRRTHTHPPKARERRQGHHPARHPVSPPHPTRSYRTPTPGTEEGGRRLVTHDRAAFGGRPGDSPVMLGCAAPFTHLQLPRTSGGVGGSSSRGYAGPVHVVAVGRRLCGCTRASTQEDNKPTVPQTHSLTHHLTAPPPPPQWEGGDRGCKGGGSGNKGATRRCWRAAHTHILTPPKEDVSRMGRTPRRGKMGGRGRMPREVVHRTRAAGGALRPDP